MAKITTGRGAVVRKPSGFIGASHQYEQDEHDFYIEPSWCVDALLDHVTFHGAIYDPACGVGTIPEACKARGLMASGCDIVNRGYCHNHPEGPDGFYLGGLEPFCADFLTDRFVEKWQPPNIVCNPPYHKKMAEAFCRRAMEVSYGKVAMLVGSNFLNSVGRYPLFADTPPILILHLSRRPSMPPGWKPDVKATGGKRDYCWVVWDTTVDCHGGRHNTGHVPTLTEWAK